MGSSFIASQLNVIVASSCSATSLFTLRKSCLHKRVRLVLGEGRIVPSGGRAVLPARTEESEIANKKEIQVKMMKLL